MKKLLLFVLVVAIAKSSFAQSTSLKKGFKVSINPYIQLPEDSVVAKKLISSINSLISLTDSESITSMYIDSTDKAANLGLLSGMAAFPANDTDNFYYKPYLTNVYQLPNKEYAIQIAYIGVDTKKIPMLFYTTTFIAKDKGSYFTFSTPLARNTINWHMEKIGMINFYYKLSLDQAKAKSFAAYTADLCKKFGQPVFTLNYYKCENEQEANQLYGLDYYVGANGDNGGEGGNNDGVSTFLSGTNSEEYRHDMFHFFCGKFIKADERCRITEEGSASIYGGDWSVPADTIIYQLKKYIAANPAANLYDLFHANTRLYKFVRFQVAFSIVINKYVEQKQGFGGVLKLLHAGAEEDNYFKTLSAVIGIDKNNFDVAFRKLL
ncbi:MAG TPA: hypothetical protein VK559_01335 [Ferruginibacter sp.]|nr:hypothetical protein [Ferruginibacter sp.]